MLGVTFEPSIRILSLTCPLNSDMTQLQLNKKCYLQQHNAHMTHDVIVFVDLNSRYRSYADDTGRVWWKHWCGRVEWNVDGHGHK